MTKFISIKYKTKQQAKKALNLLKQSGKHTDFLICKINEDKLNKGFVIKFN